MQTFENPLAAMAYTRCSVSLSIFSLIIFCLIGEIIYLPFPEIPVGISGYFYFFIINDPFPNFEDA